jgi:hypothetical protein
LQEAAARVDQAGKSTVAWIKKLSAATNLEELATKAEAARASALKAASDAA